MADTIMRKIAIIKFHTYYADYDDYQKEVATKITDWTEVDQETFLALHSQQGKHGFKIIEFVPNQEQFILDTVADYVKMLADMKAKDDAETLKRKEAAARRKQTALEKAEARVEKLRREAAADAKKNA